MDQVVLKSFGLNSELVIMNEMCYERENSRQYQ